MCPRKFFIQNYWSDLEVNMALQYLKSPNSFNWGGMMPLVFFNFEPHYCSLFPRRYRQQLFATGYKGHFQ